MSASLQESLPAHRLGSVSPRTPLGAPHLAEALVTSHLDPRVPRHADAGTFRIDLPQQVERKINADLLFRHMAIGKMGRDIVPRSARSAMASISSKASVLSNDVFIGTLFLGGCMPGCDHPEDFSQGIFTILHNDRDQPAPTKPMRRYCSGSSFRWSSTYGKANSSSIWAKSMWRR